MSMGASSENVCIAVIGTGSIGMQHLAVLGEFPRIRTLAVPKRPERIRELTALGYQAVHRLDEARSLGATLVIIAAADGGSHFAFLEKPAVFTAPIARFVGG